MSIVYPYQFDIKGNPHPLIPFTVIFKKKIKKDYFALVDSGASISFFKEEIAQILGITIENGDEIILKGVGGLIKGYKHLLSIRVAKKVLKTPVVFSHDYFVSINILGRDTFFEKFKITFDESKKRVILE